MATTGLYDAAVPRVRPVFHQELGEFFKKLRTDAGLGQRQAAMLAQKRGHSALTRQILFRLERGQIKNPEPGVLLAVAKLYDKPYPELVGQFLTRRYGLGISASDLPDHKAGVQRESQDSQPGSVSQRGRSHDAATTRALNDVTAAYETFFRAVQDVSRQLDRLISDAAPPAEGGATGSGTPRRGRRR